MKGDDVLVMEEGARGQRPRNNNGLDVSYMFRSSVLENSTLEDCCLTDAVGRNGGKLVGTSV